MRERQIDRTYTLDGKFDVGGNIRNKCSNEKLHRKHNVLNTHTHAHAHAHTHTHTHTLSVI